MGNTPSGQRIRLAFSKAGVVFHKNHVEVKYTFKKNSVLQEFGGENKDTFVSLLEVCNDFHIDVRAGNFISLVFGINLGIGGAFMPMKEEVVLKDLDVQHEPSEEFREFFDGIDLGDESALLDRFSEWVEIVDEKNGFHPNVIGLSEAVRARKIRSALAEFDVPGLEIDTMDEFTDIICNEPPSGKITFPLEARKAIANAAGFSGLVLMELDVNEGCFSFSFAP